MVKSNTKSESKSPDVAASLKTEGQSAINAVKNEAKDASDSLTKAGAEMAGEHADSAKKEVMARTDQAHDALNDVANTISEHSETLGHYTTELADGLQEFNHRIKTKSLDDLATDAKRLAKDNPALFILGAITVGAVGARFFKASADNRYKGTDQHSSRTNVPSDLPTTSDNQNSLASDTYDGSIGRRHV